jgi:Domain of unknown function (DUF4279)
MWSEVAKHSRRNLEAKTMDDEKIIPLRQPVVVGEAGGIVDASKVTLALYADALDPAAVSGLLGTEPTYAHRRGERRSAMSPPHKQGAWVLTVEGASPTGPDELMKSLLDRVPADREFWDRLRSDYTVKFVVAVFQKLWNRGFELQAETVALISRTGAPIEFEVYFDGEDGG